MNIRARRKVALSEGALQDIARIDAIWSEQAEQYPGGWLFGDWSIADAMYARSRCAFKRTALRCLRARGPINTRSWQALHCNNGWKTQV